MRDRYSLLLKRKDNSTCNLWLYKTIFHHNDFLNMDVTRIIMQAYSIVGRSCIFFFCLPLLSQAHKIESKVKVDNDLGIILFRIFTYPNPFERWGNYQMLVGFSWYLKTDPICYTKLGHLTGMVEWWCSV